MIDLLQSQRDSRKSFFYCFTSHMTTTAGVGPGQARSLEFHSVSHVGGRDASTWAIYPYLPRHIGRELDLKRRSQDLHWHSLGMLIYQVVTGPAVLQGPINYLLEL